MKKLGPTKFATAHMIVLAEYDLDTILPLVGFGKPHFRIVINGKEHLVKTSSVRLECFKRNQVCVTCGLSGNWWRLERSRKEDSRNQTPHFNLYHRRFQHNECLKHPLNSIELMTRDHIIPRSKGGGEGIGNMQTMCYPCNQDKADQLTRYEEEEKNLGFI